MVLLRACGFRFILQLFVKTRPFLRKRCGLFAILLPLCVATAPGLNAASYYVSPSGSDAVAGSIDQPWRTVQKAADTVAPGDTVYLRKGIYRELVTVKTSGVNGAPVTFCNYPEEKAVLSASGKVPAADRAGIFLIVEKSFVTIEGLELKNFTSSDAGLTPSGVWIEGGCQDIVIRRCRISGIANSHTGGNAFGIVAYGTSAVQALSAGIMQKV